MSDEALRRGRELAEEVNPGMERALEERYGNLLPGVGESIVEWAYGRQYARGGLDMRTRLLVTIGALTALGDQTAPQLRVNIASALKAGASRREVAEAIWQMALYGGLPASINALNTAQALFAELDGKEAG